MDSRAVHPTRCFFSQNLMNNRFAGDNMDKIVRQGITQVLMNHRDLLKIPLRQKAKFEGWLKFELAHYLEKIGMENVEVESKASFSRDRADITFFHNEEPHTI